MDNFKKALGKGFGIACKFTVALAGGVMIYTGYQIVDQMTNSIIYDVTSHSNQPKEVEDK